MNERPAVIIPLDGSDTATVAFGAAQAVTNSIGGMLHIVHVTEELLTEEQLIQRLKIGPIEVRDFFLHQITGVDAVQEILAFALSVETEMIVMSTHGWTYNPKRILGSTTMGILQRAGHPVMVIRPDIKNLPDSRWKPAKMLVPQDGSPTAAAAIGKIFDLAKDMRTDVDILNIGVTGEKPPTEVGTIRPPQYLDYPRYDWPAWASEFMERFYMRHPPEVKVSLFEREGEPVDVMNWFASENKDDFIVLSWHGHLEETRAVTVKGLLRKTDFPVVLVRTEEHEG